MLRSEPLDSDTPGGSWAGIWGTRSLKLEGGGVLEPDEALTREQALRLYTINNAYLHREEKQKGSLEVGKLADFILIDRDIVAGKPKDNWSTKVLEPWVGGKRVYAREGG